ncbi:hypothetical protein [Kitasatospora sp. CB01950]|uniref:hypothetical protein n=1 Tax=Kitasatospora sp. CB01950 TaxID=1703930 RepID=UPI00093C3EAB|nr:hypothetical protein [Kitasatospora sp. CB01950]OKJ05579.1 hypothetical protein AMK19_25045 [Kitasatospora sp. CB01950]
MKIARRPAAAAGIVAAAMGLVTAVTGPAAAGPVVGVDRARFVAHFDAAAGQTTENIALEPDGSADVTFSVSHQVAHVGLDGRTRVLATLPTPPDGGVDTPVFGQPLATGIARADDGTLYVLYVAGSADLTGVWRLSPGSRTPERIAALPADSIPNGMALDRRTGTLYIADSNLSTIWTVPVTGGSAVRWATAPELAPAVGDLGANGLKVHGGAVWVTNTSYGTVLRVPIGDGGRPGAVETRAAGLGPVDDFDFTGRSDQILAALVEGPSQVVLIEPDGTRSTVLTAADGLQNPTSVAVRGHTAYIGSAAYATATDPNLITAHLTPGPSHP